jgi:exonuclease III
VKDWKIYKDNASPKQAGIAVHILDKVDFKDKFVRKDKEGHFILIKGAIHQVEITIINLYVPNASAIKFIKHILTDLKS